MFSLFASILSMVCSCLWDTPKDVLYTISFKIENKKIEYYDLSKVKDLDNLLDLVEDNMNDEYIGILDKYWNLNDAHKLYFLKKKLKIEKGTVHQITINNINGEPVNIESEYKKENRSSCDVFNLDVGKNYWTFTDTLFEDYKFNLSVCNLRSGLESLQAYYEMDYFDCLEEDVIKLAN